MFSYTEAKNNSFSSCCISTTFDRAPFSPLTCLNSYFGDTVILSSLCSVFLCSPTCLAQPRAQHRGCFFVLHPISPVLISAPSVGKLSPEVILMESTYSDRYANLLEDPAMEAYFNQLPGYIQAQIRSRKLQPATLEDLKRMANEVKQLF